MKRTIWIFALATSLVSVKAYGQYFGPLPYLNYPISAFSLGMGGVGVAVVSDNAAATLGNPAQLGIFSLSKSVNASTDFHSAFIPEYPYRHSSFDLSAFNLGFVIDSGRTSFPIRISAGLGYSNITSKYTLFTSSPMPDWVGIEASNAISVSIGLDYLVKVGLGFTLNWTHFPQLYGNDFTTQTGKSFGAIAQVPLSQLLNVDSASQKEQGNELMPFYSFTIGYAMRNLSGYDAGLEPLPTEADLGWSADAGLASVIDGFSWKWLSISWSNQAGVAPITTDATIGSITGSDTTFNYNNRYQKGLGHFGIWRNLIVGKGSQSVSIRRGGQIGLGEFLYVRAGAITDAGQTTYTTFGWGLRLDGLTKCLVFLGWVNPNAPAAKFLLDHLDLQYDYSRAYGGIYQGKPFEDLNLVVR